MTLAIQSCSALVKFRSVGLLVTAKGISSLNEATERCGQNVKSQEGNPTMSQITNEFYYVALSPPFAVSSPGRSEYYKIRSMA